MMKRSGLILWILILALVLAFAASCGGDDDETTDGDTTDGDATDGDTTDGDTTDGDTTDGDEVCEGSGTLISASGDAFGFPEYEMIAGGTVSVLEMPDKTTTTDADGHWEIADLPAGCEATFVLTTDDYALVQTKTFVLPEEDVERITFQVPNNTMYSMMASLLGITPDDTKCQMVSTITRVGKSIYDAGAHGEEGATVSISPEVGDESGPVYFNDDVVPDRTFEASSTDGGVIYTNIEPGEYVIEAHKDGVEFEAIKMKCRGGVLVNASPPYGLQALE